MLAEGPWGCSENSAEAWDPRGSQGGERRESQPRGKMGSRAGSHRPRREGVSGDLGVGEEQPPRRAARRGPRGRRLCPPGGLQLEDGAGRRGRVTQGALSGSLHSGRGGRTSGAGRWCPRGEERFLAAEEGGGSRLEARRVRGRQ